MIATLRFRHPDRTLLMAVLVFAAASLSSVFAEDAKPSSSSGTPEFSKEELKQIESLEAQSNVFRQIVKKVGPAVVYVQTTTLQEPKDLPNLKDLPEPLRKFFEEDPRFRDPEPRRRTGTGSGVIVDAANGYILTNSHVVEGVTAEKGTIWVRLADKRRIEAKVIERDTPTDLAVIQIPAENLHALPIGDSDRVEVGDWVIAAGNPFGLEQSFTRGMVSAKGRDNIGIVDYGDFIQTDAAINPGNSGGPLVNLRGEMIGLNTAIATGSLIQGSMGVGFAIPSKLVLQILPTLKAGRKVARGYLGVEVQNLDPPDMAQTFGLDDDRGAVVNKVVKGSPAEEAGLRHNDIVLELNGQPIPHAAALSRGIAMIPPNTTVDLKIWRDRKAQTVKIRIAEQPEGFSARSRGSQGGKESEEDFASIKDLGIEVRSLTPALARQYEWDKDEEGVIVVKVEPLGEADSMGIKAGDVIQEVQGGKVKTARQLVEALRKFPLKNGVRLFVKGRNGGVNVYLKSQ